MKKALGSWSGMRKYLEETMLAPSLQGRVRYNCTRYVGMDGCHIFEVYLDNAKIKSFSLETVNSYFIKNKLAENKTPFGIQEYWHEFQSLLESTPMKDRSEYTDDEFCDALEIYRSQQITCSLNSENPLVRMFAILDRRVGRRTLVNLKSAMNIHPAWLEQFYYLRFDAEKVSPKGEESR